MMASTSENSLPSPDSKDEGESTSPALKFDALDFPAMNDLVNYDRMMKELGEKMFADPAYIQYSEEFRRSMPVVGIHGSNAEFDRQQFSNTMRQALYNPEFVEMMQRQNNHFRQNPQISLESLVKPGALEQFAERVALMRKDPEVEPILAEIDVCGPAALLKFGDDKQVLKKLGKSMVIALGNAESHNYDDEEQVSEGRKALEIVCGYAEMKCFKVIVDAERKKACAMEKKKTHHRIMLLNVEGKSVQAFFRIRVMQSHYKRWKVKLPPLMSLQPAPCVEAVSDGHLFFSRVSWADLRTLLLGFINIIIFLIYFKIGCIFG